jgi:murein DD-endopeptidase MepM/ murein hydrolase activator NlpD
MWKIVSIYHVSVRCSIGLVKCGGGFPFTFPKLFCMLPLNVMKLFRFFRTHKLLVTPLVLFFFLTVGVFFFNLVIVDYIDGYRLLVKGKEIGLIKSRNDVSARLAVLERRVEAEKNIDIVFEDDTIAFEPTEATLDRFSSLAKLDEALQKNVTYKCKVWTLKVNGEDAVYLRSKAEVEELIHKLNVNFIPRQRSDERIENLNVRIVEPYTIEPGLSYFEAIKNVEDAFKYLLWGAQKIEQYTVRQGDTFYLIAKKYNISFSDLITANPGLDPQRLKTGDTVTLTVPKPLISVEVSYRHIYDQIIFPPVVTKMDNTMLRTQLVVEAPGEQGRKRVFADKVRVNEYEQSVAVVNEEILKNPRVRVLRAGTLRTPDDILVSRAFLPPGMGIISDFFGTPRPGRRRHLGIDVAIGEYTAVHAFRGGTVMHAGWSTAGYGNLVIIDDGAGTQFYYGHNNQVLVTVGQTVEAGQIISLSGNTGVSTGPHVHFEVRVNNQVINPLPFLRANQ